MIRVSATNLEAYRRWMVDDEADFEQIKNYLLKLTPPTDAMKAGTAFHKVLENASSGILDKAEYDGFRFKFDLEDEIALPEIRELKIEKPITLNNTDIVLVGVVDGLDFNSVSDHKLTAKDDIEGYTNSMQWRCYLDWFNRDKFIYNLFIKGYQPVNSDPNEIPIKSLTQVTFNRYPAMHDDVMEMIGDYVDFVNKYVPELVK